MGAKVQNAHPERQGKRRHSLMIYKYSQTGRVSEGVAVAAALYWNGMEIRTLHKYLGKSEEHMVRTRGRNDGGIPLANKVEAVIGIRIDLEQSGINQHHNYRRQMAGQYLVDTLQKDLTRAATRSKVTRTTLRWTPGHEGNNGNERACKEAKRTTRGKSSPGEGLLQALKTSPQLAKQLLFRPKQEKALKASSPPKEPRK